MVCVGILSSRNKFPYSKPYFAYCTYLSHYSESDSVLDMTKVLHFKIENTPIKDTDGKRKFKRMLTFLFVNKRAVFAMTLSFEEFNLVFYTADRSAWLVLNQQGSEVNAFLKTLEVHSVLYDQRKYVFKRECFVFIKVSWTFSSHFDIGVKEKPQNVHLKLIFCHVLDRVNMRERNDLTCLTRIALYWD